MFTEDAVIVTDKGPIYGRETIEKVYTDLFNEFILATMSARTIKFPLTL